MKKQKREYKERSLYYFKCNKCKRRAHSFYKRFRTLGLCRKCRKHSVPENQLELIPMKGGE